MALYFLAVTTLNHEDVERRFPQVNVRLPGSTLEAALADPARLIWLLFRHVNGWAHSPWRHEIAARLGMQLSELQQILGDLRGLDLGSLQSSGEEGSGEEESTPVAQRTEEDPFQLTFRSEMRSLLAEAISELDDKEQQILGLYYLEELTMKEVGAILDIGESRVSQIHTAALIRLRSRLQGQFKPSGADQQSPEALNASSPAAARKGKESQ